MQTRAAHGQLFENIRTFVVLTFDDFLLRNEWSKGLRTISERRISAFQDKKVLDLCEKHDIPATLFVPSIVASTFPNEFSAVTQGKFEIAGHGFNHEDFRNISRWSQVQLIDDAIRILQDVCKVSVFGWRAPGLFLNEDIKSAISKSRIHWCSNIRLPSFVRQFPFRYYGNRKVEIPITSLFNDYDLYEKIGLSHAKVLKRWLGDFNRVNARQSGEVVTILLHPWVEVKSSKRVNTLETFLETVKANENVDFKTCTEVCRYFQIQPISHFRDCLSKVEARFIESLVSYSVRSGVWRTPSESV